MTIADLTKLSVPASEVLAGDWTRYNGFRRVVSVEHVTETRGRGSKKRSQLVRVDLVRADGSSDPLPPEHQVAVMRP